MTKRIQTVITLTLIVLLTGISSEALAQRPSRISDRQVDLLLRRIESRATTYRISLEQDLDRSGSNNANRREEAQNYVRDFEATVQTLRSNFNSRRATNAEVEEVLSRGWAINNFMRNSRLGSPVVSNWNYLRTDLRTLASYYNVSWRWDDNSYNPYPSSNNQYPNDRSSDRGGSGNNRTSRISDYQMNQLLQSIETRADTFQSSLAQALNRSRANGTIREDEINNFVRDFEVATDKLRNNFNGRRATNADVEEVLNRGWAINNFMKSNRLGTTTESHWNYLRTDLRTLATSYNVSWRWDEISYNPYPEPSNQYPNNNNPGRGGYGNNRLTGTYTLDTSRSDNVRTVIDRATSGQDTQASERIRASLERRLDAPEKLAIERSGRSITMTSSTAAQVTFDADGREQVETRPNGRTTRTTATITGDRLVIESKGDRGNDYFVMFDPIDNGRSLRVTRRFDTERLTTPVEAISIYRKTDETAQATIYTGRRDTYPAGGQGNNYPGRNPGRNDGRYTVPNETALTATLNDDLTSRQTREGDRFTMTVTSPRQYEGAILEGTVSKVERSGRVSGRPELVLNFQSIRMRNGTTSEFAGFIDQVRTTSGETVKVDNEGSVRDDSQTTKTVTRSGIGAAIGAIIGGLTGGGQGAAVGAVVGAGAGAGTVLVQGREDISLMRGTEFTIRSSAPSNIAR